MTALSEQITANGWMVPALRPAVKHFWESCQRLGGRRRRLPFEAHRRLSALHPQNQSWWRRSNGGLRPGMGKRVKMPSKPLVGSLVANRNMSMT
jgi:hypothetical protein